MQGKRNRSLAVILPVLILSFGCTTVVPPGRTSEEKPRLPIAEPVPADEKTAALPPGSEQKDTKESTHPFGKDKGNLRIEILQVPEGDPVPARISIYSADDPVFPLHILDGQGFYEKKLKPGTYDLYCDRYGIDSVWQRNVQVLEDESTDVELILNTGTFSWKCITAPGGNSVRVTSYIFSNEVRDNYLMSFYDASHYQAELPEGRYDLLCRKDGTIERWFEDIDITSGETTEFVCDLASGYLSWEIQDGQTKELIAEDSYLFPAGKRTSYISSYYDQSEYKVLLEEGAYDVRVGKGEKALWKENLKIAPGKTLHIIFQR